MWCAGLPLAAQRPLDSEERTAIQIPLRRARWQAGLCGLLTPVLFLAFLVAMAFLPDTTNGSKLSPFSTACLLAGIILVALCARGWIEGRRIARGLRGDLKNNLMLRFEGVLVFDPANETQQTLCRAQTAGGHPLLSCDLDTPQFLEILSFSGRVWNANGFMVFARFLVADWTAVAETPPIAHTAAQWLQPVPAAPPNWQLETGGRELSPSERQELRRTARKQWFPSGVPALLLSLWSGSLLALSLHEGRLPPEGGFFGFLLVMTILADGLLLCNLATARQLRHDERIGRVIIVRQRADNLPLPLPRTAADEEFVVLEVLPVSGRIWTQDGKPIPWRLLASV